jgi:dihydroorotate dehydrogenase
MKLYQKILRPLLFCLPPESVHHLSLNLLSYSHISSRFAPFAECFYPSLERELWGLKFRNPVGIAAGFDKNAIALDAWEHLGFGFMEIGTITPNQQDGNPLPRVFRLPKEEALINRMGFPNDGLEVIARRLAEKQRGFSSDWPSIPVGINIGKSRVTALEDAPADYLKCYKALRPFADFFVVNVSSPNTPGLRELQQRRFLSSILQPLIEANSGSSRPILVKIAPDLTEAEVDEILEVVIACGINGVIATNTTIDKSAVSLKEEGGLSGAPLRKKSTEMIRYIHARTEGKLPIVGVGGIFTADDAKEKLDAGASLVQVYTGFIYKGPLIARQICEGLLERGVALSESPKFAAHA